ncbi:30S ribosomal protein S24e [Candidatus Micrarchaeota archaeon]|nr:30S ribosomal protein S24e [Candidatus Micrarchaeota archaeon]
MNINIISKTDNKLLDRKEIQAEITFAGPTPPRADLRQALCEKIGANPDLVVLREINTTYGKQAVKILAHSYGKKESLMETEPEYIQKRFKMGEEPKKEEKAAEKPKEKKE